MSTFSAVSKYSANKILNDPGFSQPSFNYWDQANRYNFLDGKLACYAGRPSNVKAIIL